MHSKNTQINMTLEKPYADFLIALAEQENKSHSQIANELILEALEQREDQKLSDLAKKRDKRKAKKSSHEDPWT